MAAWKCSFSLAVVRQSTHLLITDQDVKNSMKDVHISLFVISKLPCWALWRLQVLQKPTGHAVRVFSASEQYVRYIWVNICYPCRPMLWPHSPGARETVCKTRNAKEMEYNHMKTWSLLEIKTIILGLILHFILSPKCSYFVSIISVIIDNKHRSFLLHFLLFLLAQISSLLMPELTGLQDLVDISLLVFHTTTEGCGAAFEVNLWTARKIS